MMNLNPPPFTTASFRGFVRVLDEMKYPDRRAGFVFSRTRQSLYFLFITHEKETSTDAAQIRPILKLERCPPPVQPKDLNLTASSTASSVSGN
jgi:hypothetical protein